MTSFPVPARVPWLRSRTRLVNVPGFSDEYQERICFTRSVRAMGRSIGVLGFSRLIARSGPGPKPGIVPARRMRQVGAMANEPPMVSWKSPPPSTSRVGITLETYILEGMLGFPAATGAFTSLLNQIGLAAKLITSRVRRAGLANILGYTGETNVQGERVQKLDEEANETLMAVLRRRGHCAACASEENEDVTILSTDPRAKYVVVFDPLDGSSNIDVNVSIGTIFGVLRKNDSFGIASDADFLKPGHDLLAAGYVLYGSS